MSRAERITRRVATVRADILSKAMDNRRYGRDCCAQLAENTAARLTEAMEDKE